MVIFHRHNVIFVFAGMLSHSALLWTLKMIPRLSLSGMFSQDRRKEASIVRALHTGQFSSKCSFARTL